LIQSIHLNIRVNILWHGFIVALDVDEKFLDVESYSLMLVNWPKSNSSSNILRDLTFGVISTKEWLHSKPQTTVGENDFMEFLV